MDRYRTVVDAVILPGLIIRNEFLLLLFVVVSEKERVVNLGELIGKLPAGAGSLTGLKDDRRNKVNPGMQKSETVCLA